jgi:hypothetical protein
MVILKLILLKYKIISWIGGLQYNNVMLSRDFIGLDANARKYPRAVLQTLSNGGFIPIRLESKDSTVYYKAL